MVPSEELKEAFSVKYERYGDMLFKQCMIYLGNHIEAEEVMQEVFIKLIYKAPKLSTIEDEKRWVIRVTVNLCKDRLKSFWRKKVISIEEIELYAKSEEEINLTEFILRLPYKYKTDRPNKMSFLKIRITSINDYGFSGKVEEDSNGVKSGSEVVIDYDENLKFDYKNLKENDVVNVGYFEIRESYPMQIKIYSIEKID